jgi:hypothetical protein
MRIDGEILARRNSGRPKLTSDVAVLDRLLDDLLVFTNIDGTLASKSDDLLHRPGRLRITVLHNSVLHNCFTVSRSALLSPGRQL